MKRMNVYGGILLLLLLAAAGMYYFYHQAAAPVSTEPSGSTLPTSNTPAEQSVQLYTASGSTITASNFSSALREDAENNGYYSLDTDPVDPRYHIEYIAETQYFNIALLQEPLGASRRAAEARLLSLLGISKDDLCKLAYFVSTPNSVSQQYAGTNLGFSFCANAVPLP